MKKHLIHVRLLLVILLFLSLLVIANGNSTADSVSTSQPPTLVDGQDLCEKTRFMPDKLEASSGNTQVAIYPLTVALQKEFLIRHNTGRCLHGISPERYLVWSKCVALGAENSVRFGNFVENSVFATSPPALAPFNTEGGLSFTRKGCSGPAGENVAFAYTVTEAVSSWLEGSMHYNVEAQDAGSIESWASFSAIVWADAKYLGCALREASAHLYLIVCDYRGTAPETFCGTPNRNIRSCREKQVGTQLRGSSLSVTQCRVLAEAHAEQSSAFEDPPSGATKESAQSSFSVNIVPMWYKTPWLYVSLVLGAVFL